MVFELFIKKTFMGILPRLFGRIAFEHLAADILTAGSRTGFSLKKPEPSVSDGGGQACGTAAKEFSSCNFFHG
jgi:hypothetical protein